MSTQKSSHGSNQNQNQAQGRKDDMHNNGAQARNQQSATRDSSDASQQRKDAPKSGQDDR